MTFVIFSFDNATDPHTANKFANYCAEMQGDMQGFVLPVLGKYNGNLERGAICRSDDFEAFFRGSHFLTNQESILHVAKGNKMEAHLEYLEGSKSAQPGTRTSLGCMHVVCAEEALASDAWTYRPDLDMYWVAKTGNPDNSLKDSMARMQQQKRTS